MQQYRRAFLGTAATAVGLGLAGCSEDDTGDADGGDANDDEDETDDENGDAGSGGGDTGQPDIEILDHSFYQEEFTSGVRGTAVNNTDSELSYVEANARFLDANGTQIGEGLDNVSDLAAGREWEFDCMFLGDDPSRIEEYEVEVSEGF